MRRLAEELRGAGTEWQNLLGEAVDAANAEQLRCMSAAFAITAKPCTGTPARFSNYDIPPKMLLFVYVRAPVL